MPDILQLVISKMNLCRLVGFCKTLTGHSGVDCPCSNRVQLEHGRSTTGARAIYNWDSSSTEFKLVAIRTRPEIRFRSGPSSGGI